MTSSIFFTLLKNVKTRIEVLFSTTHFQPDLHVPSLLSSSLSLQCCFTMKTLPTYSLVCPKHPLASCFLPKRTPFQRKLFLKWQNPPVFIPGLSKKKTSNHFPTTQALLPWYFPHHNLWFLVTKIRHSLGMVGSKRRAPSPLNRLICTIIVRG